MISIFVFVVFKKNLTELLLLVFALIILELNLGAPSLLLLPVLIKLLLSLSELVDILVSMFVLLIKWLDRGSLFSAVLLVQLLTAL